MNDSERPTLRDEIDILRKNVYDLQEQLQNAYKTIRFLILLGAFEQGNFHLGRKRYIPCFKSMYNFRFGRKV